MEDLPSPFFLVMTAIVSLYKASKVWISTFDPISLLQTIRFALVKPGCIHSLEKPIQVSGFKLSNKSDFQILISYKQSVGFERRNRLKIIYSSSLRKSRYLLLLSFFLSVVCLGASTVSISSSDGRKTLLIDNEPFEIKGVGGEGDLKFFKSTGGNAIRTWGIDHETQDILDEAHHLGLKVVLGYWLGHERHGFDYTDWDSTKKQADNLFDLVKKFKDHPALLLWSLGNEMEGYNPESNPAIYNHIEYLAKEVKKLDSRHPIMTVTAEIGKRQVAALNRYCPSIDVHGINSYGGVSSLAERYRKAGGKKPFILTEYGQPGTWELRENKWGMHDEHSSTEKAFFYRKAYETVHADPLCLGSFAFTWGSKQEASATWFGMLLPSGEKLACVDELTEVWSGSRPHNLCPEIHSLSLKGPNQLFDQGQLITVTLDASDPEKDNFQVEWVLSEDWKETAEGGDHRPTPPFYAEAILPQSNRKEAKIRIPQSGGTYRIYVYLRDGKGGAATANLSIKVRGKRKPVKAKPLKLPLTIIGATQNGPYAHSGWMGNHENLKFEIISKEYPKIGEECTKVSYKLGTGWAGIVWQHPPNDWGDRPGGFDLSGAEELSFWARGEKGGEKITAGIGLIEEDKLYHDTFKKNLNLTLMNKWVRYQIDLTEADLSRVKTPFYFSAGAVDQPFSFFLDEVMIK